MKLPLLLSMLLLAYPSNSRKVPKALIDRLTMHLTGDTDVVKGRIMTGGYFEQRDATRRVYGYGRATTVEDSSFSRIMLYKDGSFHNELRAYQVPNNCQYYKNDTNYMLGHWGVFSITNDTVIAQLVQQFYSPNGGGWQLYELRYKIIDPGTLQLVRLTNIYPPPSLAEKRALEKSPITVDPQPWKFFPCDKIKPVNYWLKSEDWFWLSPSARD